MWDSSPASTPRTELHSVTPEPQRLLRTGEQWGGLLKATLSGPSLCSLENPSYPSPAVDRQPGTSLTAPDWCFGASVWPNVWTENWLQIRTGQPALQSIAKAIKKICAYWQLKAINLYSTLGWQYFNVIPWLTHTMDTTICPFPKLMTFGFLLWPI